MVLAPVELERLARPKRQGHEGAAACRLLLALLTEAPRTGKRRNAIVGPRVAEGDEIGMELLQGSALLARLGRLGLQPS